MIRKSDSQSDKTVLSNTEQTSTNNHLIMEMEVRSVHNYKNGLCLVELAKFRNLAVSGVTTD